MGVRRESDDEFALFVFLGGEGVGLGGVELVIRVHNAKSLRVALTELLLLPPLMPSSLPVFAVVVSFLLSLPFDDDKLEVIKGFLHSPPTMPSSARVFNETQEASNK